MISKMWLVMHALLPQGCCLEKLEQNQSFGPIWESGNILPAVGWNEKLFCMNIWRLQVSSARIYFQQEFWQLKTSKSTLHHFCWRLDGKWYKCFDCPMIQNPLLPNDTMIIWYCPMIQFWQDSKEEEHEFPFLKTKNKEGCSKFQSGRLKF